MDAETLRQPGNELALLKTIRSIASVSHFDDRRVEEFQKSMREILILTRHIGNEPSDFDWRFE